MANDLDVYVVLIHNATRRRDKKRACGHRHVGRDAAVECRDGLMALEPEADLYICVASDAVEFFS